MKTLYLLLLGVLGGFGLLQAQSVGPLRANEQGKMSLTVPQDGLSYSILYRSRDLMTWDPVDVVPGWWPTENRVLRDSVIPFSQAYYRVEKKPRNASGDLDGDGRSDVDELATIGATSAPFNAADPFPLVDGAIALNSLDDYDRLAKRDNFPGAQSVKEVKFLITDIQTNPRLHFMNVNLHEFHVSFARNVLGLYTTGFDPFGRFNSDTYFGNESRKNLAGSLVFHENYLTPEGKRGIFTMEFWPTDPVAFNFIELAYRLISNAAPFIDRIAYHAPSETQRQIQRSAAEEFKKSFIHTIETEDLFSNVDYQPMNQEEAFGRLVVEDGTTTLSARDIVIFKNLPNDLTHIAGIITEIPQTPLSHINLKARQNDTPNSFIANASMREDIIPLIGENVFYKVTPSGYEIRAASQEELENYFESIRPTTTSFPPRDLTITTIQPFSSIVFAETTAFGGKTTNLAELKRLQPTTTPDGFGVPFYFYDEFMKHNGFYDEAIAMIADSEFQSDPAIREARLKAFRTRIKKESTFPTWMHDALTVLQGSFPEGITPRLRSSANAEDSVEFNGAGLYDSFTHKADEGHITKSVRQVYASLWNYRAYEEREFYRIDHLAAAMGITVHPNYKNEQANGVAVARNIFDPNWVGYYVNSQIGEDLVTNPELNSTPEELLAANLAGDDPYEIQYIRYSNQLPEGETVLTRAQVLQLVEALRLLNNRFRTLYSPAPADFAMEIEFKITESGELNIKQARPWVN